VAKVNDDLTNLIASMNMATVFVDRAMRIKRFTPMAAEVFSIRAVDEGRSLLDLTHRLDYPRLREDLWRVLETLRYVEREVRSEDGRWYLVRITPYRSSDDRIEGAVINLVDVSELHRALEELRARDERLRLVAESTRDYAIITLTTTGHVTSFNKGAELMFGYTEGEMLGRHFSLLFVPEDRVAGAPESELRQAQDHGRAVDELWHLRKDGSRFYCSGITTPFHDGAGPGYSKIARDLTERQLLERQRDALLESEKQVRKQLEAASAARSEFLAIMSHELKNPLNLIVMGAELLSRSPQVSADPGLQRAVDMIRRTVRVQSQIIDDLLDLSRLSTGKLSLHRTAVQVRPIVERIVQAVQGEAQAKAVALTVQGEDVTVLADAIRYEQIVWNLVSNALKFTNSGGAVTIDVAREDGFGRLTVTDTGRGIDPGAIEKIFDMFEQGVGRASTRREGGLGIGLALVRQLTDLHDGRIEVHSAGPGHGACFSVWIPLYLLHGEEAGAAADDAPPLHGLRVLLVEDSVETLESMTQLLSLEGAEVVAARTAAQALEAAGAEHIDLVISDVAMPDMDGLQLAAELRKRPRSAAWPMVALTGFSSPQDVKKALKAGFDAHLAKPIAVTELKQTVGRLLRQRQ
jgi:two-component system CheB/CheR fusion protein